MPSNLTRIGRTLFLGRLGHRLGHLCQLQLHGLVVSVLLAAELVEVEVIERQALGAVAVKNPRLLVNDEFLRQGKGHVSYRLR